MSHSRATEHLVLVPAMEAPYVHRKNSIEKCTMLADVLLTFCTETLVPFGALEYPNLCKKVCCDNGIAVVHSVHTVCAHVHGMYTYGTIKYTLKYVHRMPQSEKQTQRHFEMSLSTCHAAQLSSGQFCKVTLSLYNCYW